MSPRPSARRRTWTSPAALLALACFVAVAVAASWLLLGRTGSDGTAADGGPSRSSSTAPAPAPTATAVVPRRLPVLDGPLRPDDPSDVVWVQGDLLHDGRDAWPLSPRSVDAFVLARGAVWFLDSGRLWTTDTQRVRDTGVGGAGRPASDLVTDRGGLHVRVTVGGRRYAWDTRTGRAVAPRTVVPLTRRDLLGDPVTVRVRGERSDVPSGPPVPALRGPGGRWSVVASATEPLVAVTSATGQQVPLRGVVGDGFELARWTGAATFHGLALQGGRPTAVVACDLRAERCETLARVSGGESLLLGGPTGS